MGQERRPWMSTPLPRPREARQWRQGKDKGGESKKFEGNCFWCGAYGHMMEDCQKKAAGKPQVPKSPRGADPKPKGKGKGGKGKKGASSLDEWPDGQEKPPSDEKAHRGGSRSLRWCCQPTREVQSTRLASLGKNPETGTISVEILARVETFVPMLSTLSWERDSGCAASTVDD